MYNAFIHLIYNNFQHILLYLVLCIPHPIVRYVCHIITNLQSLIICALKYSREIFYLLYLFMYFPLPCAFLKVWLPSGVISLQPKEFHLALLTVQVLIWSFCQALILLHPDLLVFTLHCF